MGLWSLRTRWAGWLRLRDGTRTIDVERVDVDGALDLSACSDAFAMQFDRHAHHGGLAWHWWWEFGGCFSFALSFITVADVDQLLSTTALQPAVEADIYFSNLFWFEIAVLMSKAGNNINGDDISSLMSVFETRCRNLP